MKVVRLCIVLGALQVLLVLASWLVTAVMPETSVRSLLSPEGIRWFFGHFTENMAQPLLVWIVLLYVAFNAYRRAGLQHAMSLLLKGERLMLRQRSALWLVLIVVGAIVAVIMMLIVLPNPLLASVTGSLFPSSFSSAFIPIVAFSFSSAFIPIVAFLVFIGSITYAMATGQFRNFRRPYQSRLSIWLLVYILAMQLYQSLRFVFGY